MHGRITDLEATKPVKIDEKDRKILTLLSENSRIPLTKLTKTVKLSRDAVDYRIKRLMDKGVIVRFFPLIDFKKFGYTLYHVFRYKWPRFSNARVTMSGGESRRHASAPAACRSPGECGDPALRGPHRLRCRREPEIRSSLGRRSDPRGARGVSPRRTLFFIPCG